MYNMDIHILFFCDKIHRRFNSLHTFDNIPHFLKAADCTMPNLESMSLLETTQRLIEIERSLTSTMERVEPWLPQNTTNPSAWHAYTRRVRPIPTSMEQVETVLAVARNYSSRTSAPAGWNPSAPVVGFATPNPLPHQLRGGALAALELERARQEERNQKRKRQAEEDEKANAKKAIEVESKKSEEIKESELSGKPLSAKTTQDHNQVVVVRRTSAVRPAPQIVHTTMNLSDSSSDEEGESDDD